MLVCFPVGDFTYHDEGHGEREHHDLPVLDSLDPVLLIQNLVQALGSLGQHIHGQLGASTLLLHHDSGARAGHAKQPVQVFVIALDPSTLQQVAVATDLRLV